MVLWSAVGASAISGACASRPGPRENVHAAPGQSGDARLGASPASPLVIRGGDTFTIKSAVMGEVRRINVYAPSVYGQAVEGPVPVLYLLDGGLDEDFLHIAGLVQVLVSDGSMRPCLLVGIENTQRRRDMTGPTTSDEDRKIAPVVGGSATFRRFIGDELMPAIRARYRTTDDAAIVGESLAGLFVLETFFERPEMFRTYIAIDPSLWWNHDELVRRAEQGRQGGKGSSVVTLVTSGEPSMTALNTSFADAMRRHSEGGVDFSHISLANESHATVFHPGAMAAFRAGLGPVPAGGAKPSGTAVPEPRPSM